MRSVPAKLRALRIGVVLGDTVIDERTLSAPATFSIGRSMRNTIAVPVAGLPRSWPLLTMTEAGVLVRLSDDMDVRVARDGGVLRRRELVAGATRHRDHVSFVVRAGGHGKIQLGEVRVLFQEVNLPPPSPRPMLPRSVRGTFADRIDRRLATFAAVSIAGHLGLMTIAHLHDAPGEGIVDRATAASYVPDTVAIIDAADLAFLDPEPGLEPEPDATKPKDPKDPAPITKPTPGTDTAVKPTPGKPKPPRDPAAPVGLPEDATRWADELFADSKGGNKLGNMDGRKPGSDLAKQLDEIKDGDQTASIGGKDVRIRDSGGPRPGTVDDHPIVDGPGPVTQIDPDKGEHPPGRIKPIQPPRTPDGPDVNSIVRKISTTYMPGLQRCYKKSLGGVPTMAGKINLTFTVTERGVTTDSRAKGLDPTLEQCVEGLMEKWSFTPVVDEDGDTTEVDVKLGLQLTPH